MKIGIIPAGSYMTNCYIVIDESTNESIVIDPGDDARRLLEEFDKTGSHLNFIILTHGHADHTAAVDEFKNKYNVDVYMSKKDSELIDKEEYMFGNRDENANKFVKDGDVLKFGSKNIKCIETPGHTPGGICYLIEDCLFSGDTLFNSSIGRTDFPGGDYAAIINSIKNKLMKLDDKVKVYPGHGTETTIGFERQSNPFL